MSFSARTPVLSCHVHAQVQRGSTFVSVEKAFGAGRYVFQACGHRVVLFPAMGAYLVSFFVARALGLVGCSSFPVLLHFPAFATGLFISQNCGTGCTCLLMCSTDSSVAEKTSTFSAFLGVGGSESKSVKCCPSFGVFSHLSSAASASRSAFSLPAWLACPLTHCHLMLCVVRSRR